METLTTSLEISLGKIKDEHLPMKMLNPANLVSHPQTAPVKANRLKSKAVKNAKKDKQFDNEICNAKSDSRHDNKKDKEEIEDEDEDERKIEIGNEDEGSEEQLNADKLLVYAHPLFPLLALLFEKCEHATHSIHAFETDTSLKSFDTEIVAYIEHHHKSGISLFTDRPEVDSLVCFRVYSNF